MKSTSIRLTALAIGAILMSDRSWIQTAAAQVRPTNEFALELSRRGLVFDAAVFRDFDIVRVLPNPHFTYSFAVRHRSLPLEVRFATRELPTGQVKEEYLRSAYANTSIMNMTRKDGSDAAMIAPQPFDKASVREEFNADWGVTSKILPDPTFAKYESGLVNIIYQEKGRSFGYMIYLFNGDISGNMQTAFAQVFHAMRFK